MSATPSVLQAQNLNFCWPASSPLFRGLSLELPAGLSLLRGDESTGKTTLLRLIAGDLAASQGTMSLNGVSLQTEPDRFRAQVFRTDPRSQALEATTPNDWFSQLRQHTPGLWDAALPGLIAGFSLEAHIGKPMYMLSAGSKRKVWLTAALASRATLTLLDEPFAALDVPSIRFLIDRLQTASRQPGERRAWLIAGHEASAGLAFASVIDL